MTNLAGKPPLGLKDKSVKKKDAARLEMVARLPCVCCGSWPVTVHHCIHGRFSQHKRPDAETIPLCHDHHQGANGVHTRVAWWQEEFGQDVDYLPEVDRQIKAMRK